MAKKKKSLADKAAALGGLISTASEPLGDVKARIKSLVVAYKASGLTEELVQAQNWMHGKISEMKAHATAAAAEHTPGQVRPNNIVATFIGQKRINGVARDELCLTVGVRRKVLKDSQIPEAFRVPVTIPNTSVATDVIEVGPTVAFGDGFDQREVPPVRCGSTIGLDFTAWFASGKATGTLSCLVRLADGATYLLSNNHVIGGVNTAPLTTNVLHPGFVDSDLHSIDDGQPRAVLGKLQQIHPLKTIGMTPQAAEALAAAVGPDRVDAALALVEDGMVRPEHHLFRIDPEPLVGVDLFNREVCKEGMRTGFRSGRIIGINGRTTLSYGPPPPGANSGTAPFAHFEGQLVIVGNDVVGGFVRPFGAPGDSGSLVVDRETKKPVGLLFAGAQSDPDFPFAQNLIYANPIRDVMDTFGIQKFLNGLDD